MHLIKAVVRSLTYVNQVTRLGIQSVSLLWLALEQLSEPRLDAQSVTERHDEQVSKGDGDDPLYVVECDLAGRTMNIVNPAGETCIYIQKRCASCWIGWHHCRSGDARGCLNRCPLRPTQALHAAQTCSPCTCILETAAACGTLLHRLPFQARHAVAQAPHVEAAAASSVSCPAGPSHDVVIRLSSAASRRCC